jgi:hypothetical protein
MSAPRWAPALFCLATVAAGTTALATPAAAAAQPPPARWQATAQGDSQYYQLTGKGIPLSPDNSAGSLTSHGFADDSGSATAFAGAPYFGNAAQHAPGTINGAANVNGFGQFQFPFTRLPQYIELAGPGQHAQEDGGYYRLAATTGTNSAEAHADRGAPAGIPAPNRQETSHAAVQRAADGTVLSEAGGSAAGFVMGDLEVGESVVTATVTDRASDQTAQIQGHSSGWFTIGGQKFGFDSDKGFSYAGQEMSQQQALGQANDALKAIGVKLDILTGTSTVDAVSGITDYVIGGLRMTTTQNVPTLGDVTFVYVLGRAEIITVNRALSFVSTGNSISAPGEVSSTRSRYGVPFS